MKERIRPKAVLAYGYKPNGYEFNITKIAEMGEERISYDDVIVDSRQYFIMYKCPKCGNIINNAVRETECNICGTIYDWSGYPARIKTIRSVEW